MIENTNDYHISFSDLLYDAEKERQSFTKENMFTFGIDVLDQYTIGIFPHDLVVIGADSGIGKTEHAYKCAVANAKKWKKVLFFALEGNIHDIAWRYTQSEINKAWIKVKTAEYRVNVVDEHKDFAKAIYTEVAESNWWDNLHIYNKKEVPTIEFITELMRKSKDFFDMFIIDHLHYIQYNDSKTEHSEISKAMRILQQMTWELKKPIVLVWHLRKRNIDVDPTMYDLHGSSNIPKEASTVILLSRMEINNIDKWVDNLSMIERTQNSKYSWTKISIVKNRAWMPTPTRIWAVYNREMKDYEHKYTCLLTQESVWTEDDIVF